MKKQNKVKKEIDQMRQYIYKKAKLIEEAKRMKEKREKKNEDLCACGGNMKLPESDVCKDCI